MSVSMWMFVTVAGGIFGALAVLGVMIAAVRSRGGR
jgi:hypothetical protein